MMDGLEEQATPMTDVDTPEPVGGTPPC